MEFENSLKPDLLGGTPPKMLPRKVSFPPAKDDSCPIYPILPQPKPPEKL